MIPKQKPGQSKQDYETPDNFFNAVEKKFGKMDVDLAASENNTKCKKFYTEKDDSLSLDWPELFKTSKCWLNPPFGNIAPWAKKCAEYSCSSATGIIYLLTPASIGSNWFAKYVYPFATVIALQGRLTFKGASAPYPKDCMLSVFFDGSGKQFKIWDWRKVGN